MHPREIGPETGLRTLQVGSAVASFVLAVVGCWLARGLERAKTKGPLMSRLLVGGNTLAAGILLAASLSHMLPDAMEALKDVTEFPLAPTIAGSAFCFLVVLGELVSSCMPKREDPHTQTACVAYEASFAIWPRWELVPPHGCDDRGCDDHDRTSGPTTPSKSVSKASLDPKEAAGPSPRPSEDSSAAGESSGHGGGCCKQHSRTFLGRPTGSTGSRVPEAADLAGAGSLDQEEVLQCYAATETPAEKGHNCHSHSSCCRVHRHSDATCSTAALPKNGALRGDAAADQGNRQPLLATHVQPEAFEACPAGRGHDDIEGLSRCHVRGVGGGPMSEVKSYLLFFALCFHSVMEGLGLGSAPNGALMLPVVIAILAHKGLAAFALGCSLTQSDLEDWKFWVFVFIFAAGTPIGCLLGALFVGLGAASQSVASGICIALASGTFLQVSSMELLPRVLAEEEHKILAGCLLSTGFISMSLLAIWC